MLDFCCLRCHCRADFPPLTNAVMESYFDSFLAGLFAYTVALSWVLASDNRTFIRLLCGLQIIASDLRLKTENRSEYVSPI